MDFSREIASFASTAREYCLWCENQRVADTRQLHHQATRHLARLYTSALDLPDVDLEGQDQPDLPALPNESRTHVYKSFADLPFQYYREVFDPAIDKDDQALTGDLADDLTDIYLDLKRGLTLLDQGAEPAAVFEWRFSFGIHWGRHATSALRALHCFNFPDG